MISSRRGFMAGMATILTVRGGPSRGAQPLTIVADEWPPFSGSALPKGGISLDVIVTVLARAGYETDAQILPWARIMDGARAGGFDIVGNLFFDPALTEVMTYSDPYYETQIKLLRRVGDTPEFDDIDSLRPYSIAVGDGFIYSEEFDRADFLDKVVVTTTLQGVQMVAYGRAQLTLDSVEVIDHAIRKEDPALADLVEYLPKTLARQGIHMAVRNSLPGRDDLIAAFNETLAAMRTDGSLEALLGKHNVL